MTTTPRDLVLLRINDQVSPRHTQTRSEIFEDWPCSQIEVMVFSERGYDCYAINDWERAIAFWSNEFSHPPDLIVADVHFDHDETSPLNYADARRNIEPSSRSRSIPTGLSHLKPIAAMARSFGRPIGIGIHTAESQIWEEELIHNQNRMGFFAAHEIGELAAILGDEVPLHELKSPDSRLKWCFRWLRNKAHTSFKGALNLALVDYRKKLVSFSHKDSAKHKTNSVYMLPKDWSQLMRWSEISKRSNCIIKRCDFGIKVTYGSGDRDCIDVASVFADSVILEEKLPSDCFDSECTGTSWDLAPFRYPKIGKFIQQLGGLAQDFKEACLLLKKLSGLHSSHSTNINKLNDNVIQRGLAMVFMIVTRDYKNNEEWKNAFSTSGWNPSKREFTNDLGLQSGEKSLAFWLDEILLNIQDGEWIHPDDVVDELSTMRIMVNQRWVQWHLELLENCGSLKSRLDVAGVSYMKTGIRVTPGFIPNPPPKNLSVEGSLISFLGEASGFGSKNASNPVSRVINNAFVHETGSDVQIRKKTNLFLEQFKTRRIPSWLKELCCEFAIMELKWENSSEWPQYLRNT